MKISYLEALARNYPTVFVHSEGSPWLYESIIHDGGDPLPLKSELDLIIETQLRVDLWRAIQVERDRRTAGGIRVGANWYHSDQPSRIQQIGLVLFGAGMPPGIMWKTMSGDFVQMTPTLAVQIFQTTAISDQTIFAIAESKRAEMQALTDPSTYNVLSGWPPIFGE